MRWWMGFGFLFLVACGSTSSGPSHDAIPDMSTEFGWNLDGNDDSVDLPSDLPPAELADMGAELPPPEEIVAELDSEPDMTPDVRPDVSCAAGTPCDDQDPCTVNDQCVEGFCRGTPLPCDDGLPCTADACVAGVCTSPITPGFCLIEGVCWSAEQPNPANGCQWCMPLVDQERWLDHEGAACDDGEASTEEDHCQAGACVGTPIVCPDDGNPCTTEFWSPSGCKSQAGSGMACDDRDPATDPDECVEGVCVGTPIVCPDDGNDCTQEVLTPVGCQSQILDGTTCDDGNVNTDPDYCQQGTCVGTPVGCVDDGNPCTDEQWQPTGCTSTPNTLPCDDHDACTVSDQCQNGQCHGQPKDHDMDGAADQACGGTDCNDEDPTIRPDAYEICDDGLDNECDGWIDTADSDCPAVAACQYHTDCYPEGVCARWMSTGEAVCSVPCAGPSDCQVGQICSKLPGSAQIGFCEDAPPGLATGTACGETSICQSGLCVDGVCADFCLDQGHCLGGGRTCRAVGDLATGQLGGACTTNPPGTLPQGQACTQDGYTYDSSMCASGHCDLLSTYGPCAPLCTSESDCSPAQECNVVMYTTVSDSNQMPYDPQFTQPTFDAITACYTPPAAGYLSDGQACTQPTQCRSYKCLALMPGNPTQFCTSFCTGDNECPANMRCKLEAVTLVSWWLQDPSILTQGPSPGSYSLVRICKFP